MTNHITRRSILAAAPALAYAPAMAAPDMSKDLHPEWFARWKHIRSEIDDHGADYDDYQDEFHRLERLLCTTQPTTAAGAAAQLEYALDDFGEYLFGNIWRDYDAKLFANLLAGIRGGLA